MLFTSTHSPELRIVPEALPKLPVDVVLGHISLPELEDRPQNPILESLRTQRRRNETAHRKHDTTHKRRDDGPRIALPVPTGGLKDTEEDIWTRALDDTTFERRNRLLNWDAFGQPKYRPPAASPFLTEQPAHVIAAIRYHIDPPLILPGIQHRYISRSDIHDALSSLLVGSSSQLFVWHQEHERLYAGDGFPAVTCHFTIDELDAATSKDVLGRLTNIGTLFRRLEGVSEGILSNRQDTAGQAFGHALTAALSFIRAELTSSTPRPRPQLIELIRRFDFERSALEMLGRLCKCGLDFSPPYSSLPETSDALLEHIWSYSAKVIELDVEPKLRAVMALLLERSTADFFKSLGTELGMEGADMKPAPLGDVSPTERVDREEDTELLVLENDEESIVRTFPTFIPPRTQTLLKAGARSLRILKLAKKELIPPNEFPRCRWQWSLRDQNSQQEESQQPPEPEQSAEEPNEDTRLEIFKVFDMEPKFTLRHIPPPGEGGVPTVAVGDFISNFPRELSLATGFLSTITLETIRPLHDRATQLSATLLSLYLSPQGLDLVAHLNVVRSFLLMANANLKASLMSSLFDDGETDDMSRPQVSSRGTEEPMASDFSLRGVGLSPELIVKDKWPPRGSNLSSHLRNVIPSTVHQELASFLSVSENRRPHRIWLQAGHRVGFTIGEVDAMEDSSWQDPLSISALDFLEMQYRPPAALKIVLTEAVMKKYRRIFVLQIRLLRLEAVMRRLHRMENNIVKVLRHIPGSTDMFRALRFKLNVFLSSFSSYTWDSAVRTHFDSFLDRLVSMRDGLKGQDVEEDEDVQDIFQLSERHSVTLDRIMTALLLRGPQKAMAARLTACMDVVLAFGHLGMQIEASAIPNEKVVEKLRYLSTQFRSNMIDLVVALEKRSSTSMAIDTTLPPLSARAQRSLEALLDSKRRREDSMSELLTRIDTDHYWRGQAKMK